MLSNTNDAFSNWNENIDLQEYFFANKANKPFIARSASNGEIVGIIVLQDQPSKRLYIHTLARKASAVRLGMTEKFKEFFLKTIKLEDYSYIYCTALKDNLPARYIYEKLGFKIGYYSLEDDHYIMEYHPA